MLLSTLQITGCGGDDGAPLACGDGTVQEGDRCVVASDLTQPRLTSVALAELVVADEGKRPLHVSHPTSVRAALLIEGEPFSSMLVVGVESKDGSKACVLGSLPLEQGPRDAAQAPGPRLATAAGELYVQPDCAALAGEAGVQTWVSFDPFEETRVEGRARVEAKEGVDMVTFLRQTRLSLDGCKAGEGSAHPESCATALEIKASPGVDVRLLSARTDSSVAVIPVIELPSAGAPPLDPADLPEETTAGQDTPEALGLKLPEVPHLLVSTALSVNGAQGEVEGDQVGLTFAIRPDPASLQPEQIDALSGWVPLTVQRQSGDEPDGKSVGGSQRPELEKLEADFMSQLVSASTIQRDSPLRFEGDALRMVRSLARQVKRYELQVCAAPRFAQAGPDADATGNDCAVQPIVVVLDPQKAVGGGAAGSAPGAATSTLYSRSHELRAGDSDTIEGTLYANTSNQCTDYSCSSDSNVGAKLAGWFKGNVFKANAYGNVAYGGTKPNGLKLRFDLFGLTVASKEWNLEKGITLEAPLPDFSVSQTFPIAKVCCPVGCLGFDAKITGSTGVEASATVRELNFEQECKNGVMDSKGRCYLGVPASVTLARARADCHKMRGHLAEIASEEENQAARAAMEKGKVGTAWLAGSRPQRDCAPLAKIADQLKAEIPSSSGWGVKSPQEILLEEVEEELAECSAYNKAQTQYAWSTNGPLAGGYQNWMPGKPSTDGRYAPGMALDRKSGQWIDLNDTALYGFVCEFQKTFELSATAGPFAKIEVEGRGSVDIGVGKLGAYVDTTVIKGSVPSTVGVRLSAEQADPFRMRTELFYDISAEFRGLDGSSGLFYDTALGGDKWRLVTWKGIEYGAWDLFHIDQTYLIQ